MTIASFEISLSSTIEAHTDVQSTFGDYTFVLCKTDRKCTYAASSKGSNLAALNKQGSSSCSITESMTHESSEVVYINNQENVIVYKNMVASLSFNISSNDFIINSTDGTWYNQFCKVVLRPASITSSRTDKLMLVENGVPTILKTVIKDTASSDPYGAYAVFILDFPEYPLDELTYSIIMSDPDVKNANGFWGDDLYFPKWCRDLIGSNDPLWTYYDKKRSDAMEMIP